jgi:quercetin dioxygenase-like cupin family protein
VQVNRPCIAPLAEARSNTWVFRQLAARLGFEPGAHESMHTHPFSAVMIELTEGDVEMAIGASKDSSVRKPGVAWFIPKESPHAAANVGQARCEFVTVAMKPHALQPMPAQNQPVFPGITRTPRFENDETRVVHVSFAPGSREEAMICDADLGDAWDATPGAMDWLRKQAPGRRSGKRRKR